MSFSNKACCDALAALCVGQRALPLYSGDRTTQKNNWAHFPTRIAFSTLGCEALVWKGIKSLESSSGWSHAPEYLCLNSNFLQIIWNQTRLSGLGWAWPSLTPFCGVGWGSGIGVSLWHWHTPKKGSWHEQTLCSPLWYLAVPRWQHASGVCWPTQPQRFC